MPGSAKQIVDAHLRREQVAADAMDRLTKAESLAVSIGAIGAQVVTVGGLAAAVVLLVAGFPSSAIAAVIPAILGGAAMVVSAWRKSS